MWSGLPSILLKNIITLQQAQTEILNLLCCVWLIIFEVFWPFWICCVEMTNNKQVFITSPYIPNEMMWCYAHLLKRIKQYITSDVLLQYQQINWFYQVQVVKKEKKLTYFVFTQLSSVHNFTKYCECKTAVICTLNLCCLTLTAQEDSFSLITLWCVAIAFTDPLGFSCVCACVCVCEVMYFFIFYFLHFT